MAISVEATNKICGATVRGLDLAAPLTSNDQSAIGNALVQHKVLAFPDQHLTDTDLEQFSLSFGPFGDDPFIAPIEGHPHVIAVERRIGETAPLFAENWHTDWSFQVRPPKATCLYGLKIPPIGGDTHFVDQQAALAAMPAELRKRLDGRKAVHSARGGYAPDGTYGTDDQATDRSMEIRPSETALATQLHPIIQTHPESGVDAIFGCAGYITGFDNMTEADSTTLLMDLYSWQTRAEFQFHQTWQPNMLLMWDNRALLHRATGGYDGHHRLLHRTTIGAS